MFEDDTIPSQEQLAAAAAKEQPVALPDEHAAQLAARAALLADLDERIRLLPKHPLNKRPVKILTRSIQTAFLEICGAAAYKRPGYVFGADFRVGKSTAVSMIKEKLRESLPHVAVGMIVAQDYKKNRTASPRMFWGDVLFAFGLTDSGNSQDRKFRVHSAIIAACREADGTDFVLLIDEGQNWGEDEYTHLRDLANLLLDPHGISVTTVVFGDPRVEALGSVSRLRRKDLWARFMMQPRQFHGIRDKDDLRFFLNEHDSTKRCEYPAGSGISYTEYFLPRAYANGWRLSGQTDQLWDALVRAAQTVSQQVTDVGMQWVGDAVIRFLTLHLQKDVPEFMPEPGDWDAAVALSGFVESLV